MASSTRFQQCAADLKSIRPWSDFPRELVLEGEQGAFHKEKRHYFFIQIEGELRGMLWEGISGEGIQKVQFFLPEGVGLEEKVFLAAGAKLIEGKGLERLQKLAVREIDYYLRDDANQEVFTSALELKGWFRLFEFARGLWQNPKMDFAGESLEQLPLMQKIKALEHFLVQNEAVISKELRTNAKFELVDVDWPQIVIACYQNIDGKRTFIDEKESIALLTYLKGRVTDFFPLDKISLILEEH